MQQAVFTYNKEIVLESGKRLPSVRLYYSTAGRLNENKSNVVWFFHALTADSNVVSWWSGLVGEKKLFNPKEHFIICVNVPSSCYGSSNPLDKNPATQKPYYHDFPLFTNKDVVKCFRLLKEDLQIPKINIGIGGSMGGMHLLEWAIEYPNDFETIIPVATNAKTSPWAIAFNASQRMCIEQDPTWQKGGDKAGLKGMEIARSIALLSYRNYDTYYQTQQGVTDQTKEQPIDQQVYRAETYQRYQGVKIAQRFNAYSYYYISKMIDSHDVGRGRETVEKALAKIVAKTLVIGVASDIIFPPSEQKQIADGIANAKFEVIESLYGHDGFLLEFEKIEKIIKKFLTN